MSGVKEFDRTFHADLLTSGCGAIWTADFRIPCLMRIDPETLVAEPFLDLPAYQGSHDWNRGPAAIRAGSDAVWVHDRSGGLLRVDPEVQVFTSIDVPFPFSEFCICPSGILGVEHFRGGRIARISPDGHVATSSIGRALRLLDTDGDLAWTVDDAEAQVVVIDVRTLEVVRRISYLGRPMSIWAGGRQAWYLTAREVLRDSERVVVRTSQGVPHDLVRLDARTGDVDHLADLYVRDGRATTRDPDGFWMAVSSLEVSGNDPMRRVSLVSELGQVQVDFSVVGQADVLVRDGDSLWISGFRRSLQQTVVSRFSPLGDLLGEVDTSNIDVDRWIPEKAPIEWPPPDAWATSVRDAVEEILTTPSVAWHRDGTQSQEPPICKDFLFERADLRRQDGLLLLDVVFTWEGEPGLFGCTFRLVQDESLAGHSDALVSIYLMENLLAFGLGISNAHRELRDGVTWLTWK